MSRNWHLIKKHSILACVKIFSNLDRNNFLFSENSTFELQFIDYRYLLVQYRQSGADPGLLRGFDFIMLPYLFYVFGQTGLSKQCCSRSDAADCGVWSGFATHPAILHTFTSSKMDLERCTRKNVQKFNKMYPFSMKMNFWVKGGSTDPPPPPATSESTLCNFKFKIAPQIWYE